MAELTEEARQRAFDVLYCSATPIGSMPLGNISPVPSRRPGVAHPPACMPSRAGRPPAGHVSPAPHAVWTPNTTHTQPRDGLPDTDGSQLTKSSMRSLWRGGEA